MQGRGETRSAGPPVVKVTSKLPLMAYLLMRGLNMVKACREGQPPRFAFYYEDPDDLTDKLELEFIASDCHEFDGKMKSLRDMLGRNRPSERSGSNGSR